MMVLDEKSVIIKVITPKDMFLYEQNSMGIHPTASIKNPNVNLMVALEE